MVTVDKSVVHFRFYRPIARDVCIAGDFNGWRLNELQMARSSWGYWLASLRLRPGRYRFRYYADGQWFADYAAFGIEYDPHGVDSFVQVEPVTACPAVNDDKQRITQSVA